MTDRRWRTVAALGSAQTLAWASSYYLPAMLAAPMARELGVATPTVFAAFSLALVVSALLGPLAGRAIDRWGGRPTARKANAGRKRYPPAKFTQPSEAWTAPVFVS
jgi:MFS family permease